MMLFSILFGCAVIDALVNGPRLAGYRAHAIGLATVLAVAVGQPLALIAVQVLIIAAFVEAAILERRRRVEEEKQAKAKVEASLKPADENVLPSAAYELLKAAQSDFLLNISGPTNAYSKPWNVLENSNGVVICQSDFPGQKCKWWKVEAEIAGDLEVIKKELMDYDTRCGWDSSLQSGKVIKTFNKNDLGDTYISLFYTAPAAGGMVASREIIDFGLVSEKQGGFDYINCSVPKDMKFRELPSRVTGERGFTHKGSGMRIESIPGTDKFKYILVNALDLGGWLPAGLINTATTGALTDSTKAMIAHLEKLRKKTQ